MCSRCKTGERLYEPRLYLGAKLGKGLENLAFIPVFKTHTHKLYILRHCINNVYISTEIKYH